MTTLRERAASFAYEIQSTLRAVLPGEIHIQSIAAPDRDDRFVVTVAYVGGKPQKVPLLVGGEHLADLTIVIYLSMDREDQYLKAIRTDLAIHSTLDRTPLVHLDYRADMTSDPVAHWQVHAERGAMSHLLARAHAVRPDIVKKPHDISSIHFPVGGERLRPCVEDFLEFLVHECGVDHQRSWKDAVDAGREMWRRRQVRTIARDAQSEVAAVLAEQGWTVEPPEGEIEEYTKIFTRW